MAWSPDYKKNRFAALKGMKIKERGDHNIIRQYFATLNGHVYGETDAPEKNQVRKSLFAGQRYNNMSLETDQSVSDYSDKSAFVQQRWKKVTQSVTSFTSSI